VDGCMVTDSRTEDPRGWQKGRNGTDRPGREEEGAIQGQRSCLALNLWPLCIAHFTLSLRRLSLPIAIVA
jgi:hypothetical protein